MIDFRPSRRAQDAWKRFAVWYGADALERKFGLQAPQDWCEVFDSLDRDTLAQVMADVKVKFPTWMPGLPEFEALIRQARKPAPQFGPTLQEQLANFVLRSRALTPMQIRSPWQWLGAGNRYNGEGFAITGVVVPADGDHPGYRVMVADMQLENAA